MIVLESKVFVVLSTTKGRQVSAFVHKPSTSKEYELDDTETVLTGLCSYRFLMSSKTVCGAVFYSPSIHTQVDPVKFRVGSCTPPFASSTNLLKMGLLVYTSIDSGVLVIPSNINSPLLVEAD